LPQQPAFAHLRSPRRHQSVLREGKRGFEYL
jgi:hypothetical protein